MKIKWRGHSCFELISDSGTVVLTDPFDESVGLPVERGIKADVVTVSHNHGDHNFLEIVKEGFLLVNEEGETTFGNTEIKGIRCFHDDCEGKKRGENIIFLITLDGVVICHMGDVGEKPEPFLIEKIGKVDVLLIPVGGFYTVEPSVAKEYVDLIKPKKVIPMHYKTRKCRYDIKEAGVFLDICKDYNAVYTGSNEVSFTAESLKNSKGTEIIVLGGDF